ncbi:MAG: thioredoxin [Acidobacteriota bacterium]
MAEGIVSLNETNFDQETRGDTPLLVDFWASWCAPCRLIGPHLEALAQEYQGRARVGKVDVDESGVLATRFQIRSIPTLLVFKGGQVVDQLIGVVPKEKIRELIDKYV